MKDQILEWLFNGHTGVSSKAMAAAVLGIENGSPFGNEHPHDPSDFNRCLLLIEKAPEIKQHMSKVAALSKRWAALVERWDDIERQFIDEVGFNWSKGSKAPKTYELMQDVLERSVDR